MKNITKILAIISLPLILSACGGGGGGGASSGGAASYTVPSCTDSGTEIPNTCLWESITEKMV